MIGNSSLKKTGAISKFLGLLRVFAMSEKPGLSKRSFSTKLVRYSSTPEKEKSTPNSQSIYRKVLTPVPKTNNKDASVLNMSKDVLKNVGPSTDKKQSKHDWIQDFVESFPDNIDPNQLLNAFVKRLGFKVSNLVTYNHLIHIFALSGDFRRAQSIFDLLKINGLTPNEITYHILMNAYSNGGKLSKTIEIFENLRKDPRSQDHRPYVILIKAYMKHKRVQDAFDVLALMKQKMTPDTPTYNALIQACIKACDNTRAWATYEMMLKDGFYPDKLTYTMLISICQKHEVEKALKLFDEMLDREILPSNNLINSLLSALFSDPSYYSQAIKIINDLTALEKFTPDDYTFAILINGAAVNKNLPDARRFFYQLHQEKCVTNNRLIYFSTLFKAYTVAFPKDRIERFAKPLVFKRFSDFSFLQSPSPRYINDCVNKAMLLVPFLEKIPLPVDSVHARSRPWASFLFILTSYNYFNEAMKWFEIFSKRFNRHLHLHFYTCMLNMCWRIHKEEAFFAILEESRSILALIGPRSSLNEREKTEYKHVNLLSTVSLEFLNQNVILGLTEFNRLIDAMDYFEILNQGPKINWKKNAVYYQPFFKAIQGSSDATLKLRLTRFLG